VTLYHLLITLKWLLADLNQKQHFCLSLFWYY